MQFCTNILDAPEESRLVLKSEFKNEMLSDPDWYHWKMDDLLRVAREKGWTEEKLRNTFKDVDRATIIAVIKGAY